MKNLIIGNTSQLAYYFDNTYEKISARNIDFENFKLRNFDRVYICFAEQRTFNRSLTLNDFMKVNYDYTLKFINFFKERSRQIIFYSTIDLKVSFSKNFANSRSFLAISFIFASFSQAERKLLKV